MRKYENVDVLATLGAVVEVNTEHYKSDFQYDIEMFKAAADNPDGEHNRLLWLSRRNGTHCFMERDVYFESLQPYNTWQFHADSKGDSLIAYAVEVTGIENGRVMGDLCELNYREHAAEVKKSAVPCSAVNLKYEDEAELQMPYAEFDKGFQDLNREHGKLLCIYREAENTDDFSVMLKQGRERREKEARPAVFKVRIQNQKPSVTERIAKRKAADKTADRAAPARDKSKNKAEQDL